MNKTPSTPRWETAVMLVSAILIWVYFLERNAILKRGGTVPTAWHGALILAVGVLVVVLVRRSKRVADLLKKTRL